VRKRVGSILLRSAALALILTATAVLATVPVVLTQSKISDEKGNFDGSLDPEDNFGWSVTNLGDIDGNGMPEVAVGAPLDDDGDTDAGALWILSLNAQGGVTHYQKISDAAGDLGGTLDFADEFGASVTLVGDLNDDGVPDLAVGAPYTDDAFADTGAVRILFMRSDGTVKGQQKISRLAGDFGGDLSTGDLFGYAVSGLGDLNGDGIPDLAVGAPFDDDGSANTGAVYILFLRADGTVNSYQKISTQSGLFRGKLHSGDRFGNAVAALGDVDGDGILDIAVGAPQDDDGSGTNLGAVWILFLAANGKVNNEQKISKVYGELNQNLKGGDLFGWGLAALGDIDRNGVPDLAVGAPFDDDGSGYEKGAIYELSLLPDGTVKESRKISQTQGGFTGNLAPGDNFGTSLAAIGDLDENGLGDLIVGAPNDDDGNGNNTGAVWVLFMTGGPTACGDADGSGLVNSTDALVTLRVSIGAGTCDLCVCDVDASGTISAVDAQRLLKFAVGGPVELNCPYCR
jgi:hypothetical protein